MKKVHAVLFAFLMMTTSLAGCLSGDAGEDGDDGQDGMSGSNGEDGQDGINGMTTLIATSPEPEGVNCPNSGTKIDAGLDVNGNGALDSEEIDSTDYICDGGSSINNMLTSIVQTDDSLECTAGSKTIAHGLDNGDDSGIPANGIMETGEIDTRITECSKYSPGIFDVQFTYFSDPSVNNLIVYNNELYFEMFNNLWKTDGTVLGTTSLINSSDGLHPYDPSDLVVFNGELYFSARDVNDGKELWKTDGTESGTQKVINLANGTGFFGGNCGSDPHDLVVLGDKLVFRTGSWGCFDRELYATDGTENGTIRLADTCDGCDDNIISMHVFNGELFFSAAF